MQPPVRAMPKQARDTVDPSLARGGAIHRMMVQGLWILALVLRTDLHSIIVIPVAAFPNYQLCSVYKNDTDITYGFYGIHTTCMEESEA